MIRYARLLTSFVLEALFKQVNRAAGYLTKYSALVMKFAQKIHPAGSPAEIDAQLELLTWAVGNLDGHTFIGGELTYILDQYAPAAVGSRYSWKSTD